MASGNLKGCPLSTLRIRAVDSRSRRININVNIIMIRIILSGQDLVVIIIVIPTHTHPFSGWLGRGRGGEGEGAKNKNDRREVKPVVESQLSQFLRFELIRYESAMISWPYPGNMAQRV